jgi:bifunctional non-homologous end joining protein LigD
VNIHVNVDGRNVRVTNLDRILWPSVQATKADLIRYYVSVAPLLLPHLAGHPLTLHRYPEGVEGPHFFQTKAPPHPDWVRSVTLRSPNDKVFDVIVIDDLPGLVWAANIGSIELHPYLGTADAFTTPTQIIFDLDPGPPAGLSASCRVALTVRDTLDELGLVSTPKSSGGKGIHVHAPVEGATFTQTKAFAHAVAEVIAQQLRGQVVTTMTKSARAGRVFIDWSQNDAWKSTVAPWSARGLAIPTVAAPLLWREVEDVATTGDPAMLVCFMADVPRRIDHIGDTYNTVMRSRQRLPDAP